MCFFLVYFSSADVSLDVCQTEGGVRTSEIAFRRAFRRVELCQIIDWSLRVVQFDLKLMSILSANNRISTSSRRHLPHPLDPFRNCGPSEIVDFASDRIRQHDRIKHLIISLIPVVLILCHTGIIAHFFSFYIYVVSTRWSTLLKDSNVCVSEHPKTWIVRRY